MQTLHFTVLNQESGMRLDMLLVEKQALTSRAQAQKAIRDRRVLVNDQSHKASYLVGTGDIVTVTITDPAPLAALAQNIDLEILHEDSSIVVVNKPAGMVVHPGAGNHSGTLVNALLYHCKNLSGIGGVLRPGIVHRLDKGTSGIIVVAKNDLSHTHLSRQFNAHSVIRKYAALVWGAMQEDSGTIEKAIGRSRVDRKKMSTHPKKGRHAITHWAVMESFDGFCLLEAQLQTGRTHQVRVHLSSIGHPIVGDDVYGHSGKRLKAVTQKKLHDTLKQVSHPLLHAGSLGFIHPDSQEPMLFATPLPDDFARVIDALRGRQC